MARRKPKPPAKPRATLAETSREAVCIVRCSTLKQGDGTSPEVQEKGMVEYARRNGMKPTVVRVFESGKDSAARPQYQAALVEARRKGNLIFWVGDRSGRNLTDHEELEREVRAGKFRVHIASENRVFNETTPDTDWFAADVNKVTHKQFSRDLRRRALEGMKARADAGEYPSKPPLGYINAPRTGVDGEAIRRGTQIQKLPWCDPLLLRMLDLRLGGASYKAIAAAVLKEGLVPAHKRGPFEQAAAATKVELLLKNPFYMGRFEWNGDEYAGTHEPVFSAAQWEQLQATFHGKPAALRIVKRDAALAGFMKCAECGCSITYDPKKKPSGVVYDYYRCANGKKQHNKLVYVKEADILAGFASAAEAIAIDTAIAAELLEILNRSNVETRAQRRRDAERFRRELAALELKEDQLTELLLLARLQLEPLATFT